MVALQKMGMSRMMDRVWKELQMLLDLTRVSATRVTDRRLQWKMDEQTRQRRSTALAEWVRELEAERGQQQVATKRQKELDDRAKETETFHLERRRQQQQRRRRWDDGWGVAAFPCAATWSRRDVPRGERWRGGDREKW